MSKKTDGVYLLVKDVLQTFSGRYGEDIIEDVCLAIESNSDWYRRYNELSDELSSDVVNNWIGKYTKQLSGLKIIREVNAKRSRIITQYTKLTK